MALARVVEQRIKLARDNNLKLFRTGDFNRPKLVAKADIDSLTSMVIFRSESPQDYAQKMALVDALLLGMRSRSAE